MLSIPDEIKNLLHQDSCNKNIRIHFPNGERSDICNDLIVMDSVKFTESLCSQNELKFGLCESPAFECEVVGVGNIKGATIEVSCEIYCPSTVSGAEFKPDLQAYVYAIPYGTFTVSEAKRQADMNHRRIQAYGGLAVNIDYENEIIKMKNDQGFLQTPSTDRRAYNPNIFNTCLMMSGARNRLSDATFTEIPASYQEYGIGTHISFSQTSYTLRCIVCWITSSDEDKMYFADYGTPTMTKEEILADIASSSPAWTNAKKFIMSENLFGCGMIVRKPHYTLVDSNEFYKMYRIGMQKGKYIYPYQASQYWGTNISQGINDASAVVIPISIRRTIISAGQTYVKTCTFNSGKIYEVDMSNYVQTRSSYPRDIKGSAEIDGTSVTSYRYDESKIDYISLINATMEMQGVFGNLSRSGDFDEINLKQQFNLVPSSSLYPGSSVYPEGVTGGELLPQDYQACWYEDEYTKPFGAVYCKYKNTSNVDAEYFYYLTGFDETVNPASYKTYMLEGNAIIDKNTYTEEEIDAICASIASNIEGVSYMPVDFVGRGLPYVEAGDTFEILTKSNDSITTIVLNRTISGEQVLTDSYKSV